VIDALKSGLRNGDDVEMLIIRVGLVSGCPSP
jgi:hypothetical protein